MTSFGFTRLISATICGTLSASTCAVRILRLICFAIALHFDSVRLASVMSENTSGSWAHLCATTWPTPPAPTIRTLDMSVLVVRVAAQALAERLQHLLALRQRDALFLDGLLRGLPQLLEQLLRVVLDVAEHVGDRVAAHLAHELERAVLVDAHRGDVGVAHEVVQVP